MPRPRELFRRARRRRGGGGGPRDAGHRSYPSDPYGHEPEGVVHDGFSPPSPALDEIAGPRARWTRKRPDGTIQKSPALEAFEEAHQED
jgi:hypothetical protein